MPTLTVRFTNGISLYLNILPINFTDNFYGEIFLKIPFIVEITGKMFKPWKVSANLICKFHLSKQRKKKSSLHASFNSGTDVGQGINLGLLQKNLKNIYRAWKKIRNQ